MSIPPAILNQVNNQVRISRLHCVRKFDFKNCKLQLHSKSLNVFWLWIGTELLTSETPLNIFMTFCSMYLSERQF